MIKLDAIRIDGDTQARLRLNEEKVAEYAECMTEGDMFPPVTLFYDGSHHWLGDGFHRYHATRRNGKTEIEAEIKNGTREEAQIYAFHANSFHGIPLTQEEKRECARRMLTNPISSSWTDSRIARWVGTSPMTVGRIRKSIEQDNPIEKSYERKDGTVVKVNTAKLATQKAKDDAEPPKPATKPVEAPIEPPVMDEKDQRIAELIDTVNELSTENQRLRDVISVGQWDASDIEKIDIQDTITELREHIKNLEIDNHALRDSRDMFQTRNAELMKTVKSLQAKIKKAG